MRTLADTFLIRALFVALALMISILVLTVVTSWFLPPDEDMRVVAEFRVAKNYCAKHGGVASWGQATRVEGGHTLVVYCEDAAYHRVEFTVKSELARGRK